MGLFKRTSTGGTPFLPSPAAAHSRPRGKGKRRLLAVLLLLVSLLALSPIILAGTPLRNWLLARAVPQFQGHIRIGGASLGWFRRPVLTDVEVCDDVGRMMLRIPRLEGSKTLLELLCHPYDLGEFRLTQPAVHVVCSRDSSNLESALAYWLQKKDVPSDSALALDGLAVRAMLSEANLVIEDEDSGGTWALDPLDAAVTVPRDRRTPIQLQLSAQLPDKRRAGKLNAEVSVSLVETKGGPPRLRAEGELHADQLPLDAAEPFLRRLEPRLKLGGWLNAQLQLHPGNGQPGTPDVRMEGTLSLQALTFSDAWLGPDVLRLAHVEAPLRIAVDGSRLTIEQLDVQSDVGKASLAGTLIKEEGGRMKDESRMSFSSFILHPSSFKVEAELNLARLAGLLPNTLHLSKDTTVQSGTLSLHLRGTLRGDSLLWEGDLHTSDLMGLYQGQRLIWKEPLTIVFAAHQDDGQALPVLERFRCDSDFLRLELTGAQQEWTARGSFNLGQLSEHLAGFIELGSLRIQGEGTVRATARRNPRGGYRLQSDLRLAQLKLIDGTQAWGENSLSAHLDVIGDFVGGYRINAGALHVLTGKDGIDLDLLEPITDLETLRGARARLRIHGDLARWQGRVSSLTGLLNSVRLAGQFDVDGRLRYEAETIQVEDLRFTGHAVQADCMGLRLNEPSLDFTTSGRWLPARESLELQHTRLSCPTVTVQSPTMTLSSDRAGAWQITTAATVQGDVARLRRCLGSLANTPDNLGGALAGRIDLRPDDGQQVAQLDVHVQNLVLGSPADPFWRESRVNVTGHAVYDYLKDSLQLVQLHLDSPTLACDAAGKVSALSTEMELSLEGKLSYDLEKLEPQLRPYLGPGVKLAGRDVRPFHLAGPLAAPATDAIPSPGLCGRLRGDAALNWQTLQALGGAIGPAELRTKLEGGWLRAAPIEATLNQGRLHLEPSLRLDPLPLEVTLPKGRVVERARLTPSACASALGYALPVMAGVAQADGEISLDLQSGRVPVLEPGKGDVLGWLTIHSAQVSGGPLVQELSVLLKGPATLTLARDNVVPFRLVNGRVYHTGLELHFPELTIRTSGSVGLDGSLSLTAEMPIPPKWLGSSKLAKAAIGNQLIRLPIGGTLSKPKIDEKALREASARFVEQAAENALRQEMDGKVKKEAENGLRKLFRSRK